MTDRPEIPAVDTPEATGPDMAAMQSLAQDLIERRRKHRSEADELKTDKWLEAEAAKLGTTAGEIDDLSMDITVHNVHSLPDF